MNTDSGGSRVDEERRLQRAIVLVLLGERPPRRWSYAQLASELHADVHPLRAAVQALAADGVVCVAEGELWASPAAVRLDELELLAI